MNRSTLPVHLPVAWLKEFSCSTALEEGLAQKRKSIPESSKRAELKRAKKGIGFDSDSDLSEDSSEDSDQAN